jgi:TonB family protein
VGSVAGQDDVKIFGEEGVKSPVVLHQEKPSYTEEAVRARVEGIVLLQLVIRKDGKADSFKVIRKLGYGLDESAISTIAHKWRFRAGTYSGSPADVQIKIEVSFMIFPGWDDTLVTYNFSKAQAERGDVAAQMQLGMLHMEGKGTKRNFIEAYKWFDIAAANGASGAAEQRDSLAQRMTPSQVAKAQKRSAAFKPKKESRSK